MEAHLEDNYEPGEAKAEEISYLINHALKGHSGHTEDLWQALAADASDCDDEGRWLRQIAIMVVGQILDRKSVPIEVRARIALDALGLGDPADANWKLKEDIDVRGSFDGLEGSPPSKSPTQIAKDMRDRGHDLGEKLTNATKIVTRILDGEKK